MGQLEVGVIAFFIIVIILLFLLWIQSGGPAFKSSQLGAWNYGLTKVAPYSCMGFVGTKGGLLFQRNTDSNGIVTHDNLPITEAFVKDANGNPKTVTSVPVMGRLAYKDPYLVKDENGKDQILYHNMKGWEGTHKDCCTYAHQSGSMGAAVFDPKSKRCYTFDWMGLKGGDNPPGKPSYRDSPKDQSLHQKDLANIFPIFKPGLRDVSTMQGPSAEKNEYMYMMPCGGQGYPACHQQTQGAKHNNNWPPQKDGCSQTGDNGLIRLYRTPARSPLPYSDDANNLWELCETMPYVKGFGYQPKEWSCTAENCLGQKDKWQWAQDPPQFKPESPVQPWNPNESNAWFIPFDQRVM